MPDQRPNRPGSLNLAADRTQRFRVLAVDHDESMLTLYRDILCFESEEPFALEALFNDDARLPSREEIDEDAVRPVFEVVPVPGATGGLEAMDRAIEEDEPFAIALVDIHLSALGEALSGIDLAEALRERDPHVEIVLLSARHKVPLK